MRCSWSRARVASWTVVLSVVLAGCGRTHVQHEVVAPGAPNHLDGPAVVLLPRTCVVDRRVSPRRAPASGPGTRTTMRLRRALDAMVPYAVPASALPVSDCRPAPDLTVDPARLAQLRASPHALDLMKAGGGRQVVVIQIKATVGCISAGGSALLAHYGGAGLIMANSFPGQELCDAEEIELSAFVFRADGAAVWVGTRAIEPGDAPAPAIERLLQRVPVALPLHVPRASARDVRCSLDDRGVTDCN